MGFYCRDCGKDVDEKQSDQTMSDTPMGTDTPETDKRVKDNKHIRFLEEDHWSLNGKFTYTHPIVALCRRLERERDRLAEAGKILAEEYEDRRSQFGSEYLWQKHEDAERIDAAIAVFTAAVKGGSHDN
jgi:hypothetical protein